MSNFLGAIAPIVEAAEQSDDDAARAADHLRDIDINRHRMAEPREIGEAKRRSRLHLRGPGSGERAEVAVGEGKKYEVGGRMAEIDGGLRLVKPSRLALQEMHGLAQNLIFNGGAVETALADHHDMAFAYAIRPGPVEGRAETRADPLHREAQGLAGDRNETLDAEHVMRFGYGFQSRQQFRRIADLRHRHDKALEIVMLMRAIERVVMRGARGEVVLCGGAQAQQHICIHPALLRCDDFHGARHDGEDVALQLLAGRGIDEIRLVQHDQVRGHELVLVNLGERIIVIDGWILSALAGDRLGIIGEAAFGNGGRIDHGDHAVDGEPRADRRPVEGLDQWLRQSEAGGLDENVLWRRVVLDQRLHGWDEILGNGAAQAAVRELNNILLRAAFDAAALQHFAVDADAAELIDDDGEPLAPRRLKQVTEKRSFPRAEEAGDDGCGDAGSVGHSAASLVGSKAAGKRAMTLVCKDAGRPEGSTTPVFALAYAAA